MARPKLAPHSSPLDESDVVAAASISDEDGRRTVRRSGRVPKLADAYLPRLLRRFTLDEIALVFSEYQGYSFDFDRVLARLGGSRGQFPRRLAGPMLVELSNKLHPGLREEFLRHACDLLHRYEGSPRLFL